MSQSHQQPNSLNYFSSLEEDYEKYRPSYLNSAIDTILKDLTPSSTHLYLATPAK